MTTTAESYNDDELIPPGWINSEFLKKVLQNCESVVDIEISNYELSPGTIRGDHYTSVIFRAQVEYKRKGASKEISMIIKTTPERAGLKKQKLEKSNIFEVETGMYTEVIPEFEKMLRSIGDETIFSAKCLYHSLFPRKVIVLEDLVPLDYGVLRERRADCYELVYTKLAKWHALSYKIGLENPSFFDKYCQGVMSGTPKANNILYEEGVQNFLKLLQSNPNLTPYKPLIENSFKDILMKCKDSYDEYRRNPQENAFYVLNHGDFHNKNLMFKHNKSTGHLENVIILDFQFSYFGPNITDLLYSHFMFLNVEQRQNNFDELLFIYYKEFVQLLKKLDFKGPMLTLMTLKQQLIRHKHYQLFLLAVLLPMWHSFRFGNGDVNEMMASSEVRRKMYENESYIKEVEGLLLHYLHLGYFED